MAPPVAEPGRRFSGWLAGQLAPDPGRLAFAAKLAIICSVTALATAIYRTPEPALAAYLAFFLNVRDRATSLILNVVLTLLVALLIAIVMVTAIAVLDHPAARVAAIAFLSLGFLFLASASRLSPLAATFALILGYALDKLGQVKAGEAATRELLYAWLFVAVPALVSIVYNVLLGQRPRRLAGRELARRLRIGADFLLDPTEPRRAELARCRDDGAAEIRKWVHLAKAELGARPFDLVRMNQAVSSTLEILACLELLESTSPPPEPWQLALADILEEMAAILARGGYPTEIVLDLPALPKAHRLGQEALDGLERAVGGFADLPPQASKAPAKAGGGFFADDAFSNPVHWQFAFKITAAAVFCYLLYSLLDWPGIHTCFITCYIVGLGTVGESVEKLALRLGGAMVGAAVGLAALLFVMPHVVSVGGLVAVIFLGALASGYVAAGSPRISYVGFQMAFAFFICTLEGPAPNFDMRTIRDRLIGIAIGNVVIYLVSTRIWPTSVAGRIDRAIADCLRALAEAVLSPTHTARPEKASAVYASAEKIEADLTLADFEPRPMRADEIWLESRRAGLEEIVRIQSAVLVAGDLPKGAELATRLGDLAGRLETGPPSVGSTAPESSAARSIREIVDHNMSRLEALLGGSPKGGTHAQA